MPLSPKEQSELGTPVNLDEIEPETNGAAETGGDEPECPDSPTGSHEFDEDSDDAEQEACVYCGERKE